MCADDFGAFGFVVEKFVHFGNGAIEDSDGEAVVVHVEDEVLAHDGEPDQTDVSLSVHKIKFDSD